VATALPQGPAALVVTQTDPAGNVSAPTTVTPVVVLTPPAPPVGTTANAATVAGSVPAPVDPGTTVAITWPDNTTTTVPVDDQGNWSVATPDGVDSGTITVVATDPAGNPSAPTTAPLDTAAPAAPVVTAPTTGEALGDPTPTVTGTGEAGATVTVTDGSGNVLCVSTVGANGTWSCEVATALPQGPATLVVTETDPAGNPSTPTTVTPVVDTTAPAAPAVTAPTTGEAINDPTPTVTGTGEAGATVTVTDGTGNALCTATVLPDTRWACTIPADKALADGPATLVVTQTDPAGNPSVPTTVTPVVDTRAPGVPAITTANAAQVAGSAEPGATVTVTFPTATGTTVVTTTADANGQWLVTTPATAVDGEVTAVATDAAGNASAPAVAALDVTAPGQPVGETADIAGIAGTVPAPVDKGTVATLTYVTTDGTTGVVTGVPVNDDGTWQLATPADAADGPVTVVAADPAGNVSVPGHGELDVTPPAKPVIADANGTAVAGTAEPGTTVTVTWPDKTVTANVSVDDQGQWTVPTPDGMGSGEVAVVATDKAGNPSAEAEDELDTEIGAVTITEANGTAVAGQVAGPVDPGTTVVITWPGGATSTVAVGPDGTWQAATPAGVGNGEVTVVATDPAGNTADGEGHLKAGVAVPVLNPSTGTEICGTAEAGTWVTISVGGATVPGCADLAVGPDGTFTCVPTTPLDPGTEIDATVTDQAGNTADAELAIEALGVEIAYVTRDPGEAQTVTGWNFEPGETVTLVMNSIRVELGTATADAQGKVTFTFAIPADAEVGTHTLTLTGTVSGSVTGSFEVVEPVVAPVVPPVVPSAPTGGTVGYSVALLPPTPSLASEMNAGIHFAQPASGYPAGPWFVGVVLVIAGLITYRLKATRS
jgi:hypothetical protein